MDTVTFMSYNSTGFDSIKAKFISDLSDDYKIDFISIQEHFKFVNCDRLFKPISEFNCYVIPGYRRPGQLVGRAKGGLAQLRRKTCDVKVTRIATSSFRIQAQVLNLPTCKVLWLNTYLPVDPQLIQYDDRELQDVLMEIRSII